MTNDERIEELIEKGKETRFGSGIDPVEAGRNGGIKSGEVRREKSEKKRDAREAARYILGLPGNKTSRDNVESLGAEEEDGITNMEILMARLYSMLLGGNIEAGKMFLQLAGFDPQENRAERESIAADRRRDVDMQFKMDTIAARAIDTANVAVNFNDEDGNPGVVIYLPEIESLEDDEGEDEPPEE